MGADYGTADRLRLAPARLLAGCYLDLGGGVEHTTLVVGSGRSGSTWVAELVNHRNEYRLVFEPFRGDRVRRARPFRRGHYIDPREQDHPLAGSIDALLAGHVRSWWTDRHNRRRVATRRIVKEVRITNLVPWICARHRSLRVVYVVRDPVAVAQSWLELGWGDDLDDLLAQDQLLEMLPGSGAVIREVLAGDELFDRHVLRWCLENAVPLAARADSGVHLVVYERLRAEPEREIDRLFSYLGRDPEGAGASVRNPSATAGFPRPRSVQITESQRRRAEEIVSAFGLNDVVSFESDARRA